MCRRRGTRCAGCVFARAGDAPAGDGAAADADDQIPSRNVKQFQFEHRRGCDGGGFGWRGDGGSRGARRSDRRDRLIRARVRGGECTRECTAVARSKRLLIRSRRAR